jgi:glutamine synthetase
MVPSSQSIALANTVLNTTVADVLSGFADRLETSLKKGEDINTTVNEIIRETYRAHRRIIFNGNGYAEEWIAEAEKRGLPNIKSTVEAIGEIVKDSSVELFERHRVYSKEELESRRAIYCEKYSKQIAIEANMMISMGRRSIIPAANRFIRELADTARGIYAVDPQLDISVQKKILSQVIESLKNLEQEISAMEELLIEVRSMEEASFEEAYFYRYRVFEKMQDLRRHGDRLEELLPKNLWPFPSYEEMLLQL